MARRSAFKQADITRAIKGATSAGLQLSGCKIDPATGAIELTFSTNGGAAAGNSFDAIMSGARR